VGALLLLPACGDGRPERWDSLDELRRTDLGGGRTAPAAGVSTRIPDPPRPLDMARYAGEHDGAAFRTFMNRCGACHAAPDPELRTRAGWEPIMRRMEAHMASAGLLPPRVEEQDTIRAFLARHAAPPATDSAANRP
jgi:hypothetical protein